MKSFRLLLVFAVPLLIGGAVGCGQGAEATIRDSSGREIGSASFAFTAERRVRVVVEINSGSGVAAGPHGLHVHAGGVCDAPAFAGAGMHFNPGNTMHGDPLAPMHHAGDFGNIIIEADGSGRYLRTSNIDLSVAATAPNFVGGRTIVMHLGEDDLMTQPSGYLPQPDGSPNPGAARIACGVIVGN